MTLPNYSVIIFDQVQTGLKMDDRALSSYISNRMNQMRFDFHLRKDPGEILSLGFSMMRLEFYEPDGCDVPIPHSSFHKKKG